MAFKLVDRVRETTTTTGTGNITLAGAVSGFRSFGGTLQTNDTFPYAIVSGAAWETGVGTYLGSNQFSRSLQSSSTGALISLTGTSDVFLTATAATYHTKENVGLVVDGGGSPITAGSKGYREVPFQGTITGWTLVGDISGNCTVDVKLASYANFPTTASIAGTEKPTLASQQKNQDVALTSWTTTVSAGDIIEFVVEGTPTVNKIWLTLQIER